MEDKNRSIVKTLKIVSVIIVVLSIIIGISTALVYINEVLSNTDRVYFDAMDVTEFSKLVTVIIGIIMGIRMLFIGLIIIGTMWGFYSIIFFAKKRMDKRKSKEIIGENKTEIETKNSKEN